MARIAFLDDSFPFTGETLRTRPLGGIQTATVMLAETFAARGHNVAVHGMIAANEKSNGVLYRPLFTPWGETYDLLISNCVAKLFSHAGAGKRALWTHGAAHYMAKPRHLWPYLRYRPSLVFSGDYHRSTWPAWLPAFHPAIIPMGLAQPFVQGTATALVPGPRAVFFSNPRRSLDWVLDIWARLIHPAMPEAQLHIYAGSATYGVPHDDKIERALAKATAYTKQNVIRHDPVNKAELAHLLGQSRVMLYRGDETETFCQSAAEAQAMGVPIVTAGIGGVAERVLDGQNGFIKADPESFAQATLKLLADDALWIKQHKAALEAHAVPSWDNVAAAWEEHFGLEMP